MGNKDKKPLFLIYMTKYRKWNQKESASHTLIPHTHTHTHIPILYLCCKVTNVLLALTQILLNDWGGEHCRPFITILDDF